MPEASSTSPALSLAALGEMVDLLGVVVARMSDKLDQHGETLAVVQKTALESRDAAQAAKAFTDPQRYGRHIGNEIDKALAVPLGRLESLQLGLTADRLDASRAPFIALFGLILALGLTIALPRFMAGNGIICAVLGGEWLRGPETGKQACVFYAK